MAKELPWFKFLVSEWTDGDITLEDYEVQGLFINICAYYWSNECEITLKKVRKKFKDAPDESFESLLASEVLKIGLDDLITINFLDEQRDERLKKSDQNAENGKKGGRPRKQKETEIKPLPLESLTEPEAKQKALREEEIRKDKKKKEESNGDKPPHKQFIKPTPEEILSYMLEKGLERKVAEKESEGFFNYYESINWRVGKSKMSKWKSSVSGWINRMDKFKPPEQKQEITGGRAERTLTQFELSMQLLEDEKRNSEIQ